MFLFICVVDATRVSGINENLTSLARKVNRSTTQSLEVAIANAVEMKYALQTNQRLQLEFDFSEIMTHYMAKGSAYHDCYRFYGDSHYKIQCLLDYLVETKQVARYVGGNYSNIYISGYRKLEVDQRVPIDSNLLTFMNYEGVLLATVDVDDIERNSKSTQIINEDSNNKPNYGVVITGLYTYDKSTAFSGKLYWANVFSNNGTLNKECEPIFNQIFITNYDYFNRFYSNHGILDNLYALDIGVLPYHIQYLNQTEMIIQECECSRLPYIILSIVVVILLTISIACVYKVIKVKETNDYLWEQLHEEQRKNAGNVCNDIISILE